MPSTRSKQVTVHLCPFLSARGPSRAAEHVGTNQAHRARGATVRTLTEATSGPRASMLSERRNKQKKILEEGA